MKEKALHFFSILARKSRISNPAIVIKQPPPDAAGFDVCEKLLRLLFYLFLSRKMMNFASRKTIN